MDQNTPLIDPKKPKPSIAYQLGCWTKCNILYIVLVGAIIFLLYHYLPVFAAAEVAESNALTTYVMAARHRSCKGTSGCGKECPFIDNNDPRVVAQRQLSEIDQQNEFIQYAFQMSNEESGDVEGPIASILKIKERSSLNSSVLTNLAHKLYDMHLTKKSVDSKAILAKSRINAVEAAIRINMSVFMSALTAEASYKTNKKLKGLPKIDTDKVHDYDAKMALIVSAVKEIEELYNKMTANTSATSAFNQHVTTIRDDNASSDRVIEAMAILINQSMESADQLNLITIQYERVKRTNAMIMGSIVESFSNDLPTKMNADSMNTLIASGNYDAALIKTALEPDIAINHRKFAKERSSFDSGGGVPSVRDDDNDLIPWVGIFGRPSYRRSDGTSVEKSSPIMQLKSIPSDNPEDMMRAKTARLTLV